VNNGSTTATVRSTKTETKSKQRRRGHCSEQDHFLFHLSLKVTPFHFLGNNGEIEEMAPSMFFAQSRRQQNLSVSHPYADKLPRYKSGANQSSNVNHFRQMSVK
jgi:hypothetical protein